MNKTVLVEDTNSANGVYVGQRRLEAGHPHVWSEGEIVRLGEIRLFLLPDCPAAAGVGEAASSEPSARQVLLDPTMVQLDVRARACAASDIGILLLRGDGERQEVLAETIHRHSARANKAFCSLSCASLTETLLESELFGHERAERAANALGRARPPEIGHQALERLRSHTWPGNTRELRNTIEEAVILCGPGGALTLDHFPAGRDRTARVSFPEFRRRLRRRAPRLGAARECWRVV